MTHKRNFRDNHNFSWLIDITFPHPTKWSFTLYSITLVPEFYFHFNKRCSSIIGHFPAPDLRTKIDYLPLFWAIRETEKAIINVSLFLSLHISFASRKLPVAPANERIMNTFLRSKCARTNRPKEKSVSTRHLSTSYTSSRICIRTLLLMMNQKPLFRTRSPIRVFGFFLIFFYFKNNLIFEKMTKWTRKNKNHLVYTQLRTATWPNWQLSTINCRQ